MGTVSVGFSTSLDGFIAGPNDDITQVFAWMNQGDTAYTVPSGRMTFHVAAASAELMRELHTSTGALVTGRRMFDMTKGWGGVHPLNVPVFVVTHTAPDTWPYAWPRRGSPFNFVIDGVASAIAQAQVTAGNERVVVDGASIVQQAITAGLVDELGIDLVPVLLGQGVRYFDHLGTEPIALERRSVVAGTGVTHLRFRIIK